MCFGVVEDHEDFLLGRNLLRSTNLPKLPKKPLGSIVCRARLKRVENTVWNKHSHASNDGFTVSLWRNYQENLVCSLWSHPGFLHAIPHIKRALVHVAQQHLFLNEA